MENREGPGAGRQALQGLMALPFGGEVFVEWVAGQCAQAGHDTLGAEDGSGHGGMGVGVAEQRIDGGLAEGVIAASSSLSERPQPGLLGSRIGSRRNLIPHRCKGRR